MNSSTTGNNHANGLTIRRARTRQELADLHALRREVFVQEQGIPEELEMDAEDTSAIHAIVLNDKVVVGTGRLVLLPGYRGRIGRMAVRASLRRRGIGSLLLGFLEREAERDGVKLIQLHAQMPVKEFYRKHGYSQRGAIFLEAGIDHVLMQKKLK